jgi:integrase
VILRERRERALAAGRHGADEFVFSTRTGKPLSHRNATRTILRASENAGLEPVGFYVLRHGFASALTVDLGLDPVQVAKQLGHARPSVTLDTYSHLFDRARHAENMRERLASSGLAAAVAHLR